jgi:serine protease Do
VLVFGIGNSGLIAKSEMKPMANPPQIALFEAVCRRLTAVVVMIACVPGCGVRDTSAPAIPGATDDVDGRVLAALSAVSERVSRAALAGVVKVETEQVSGEGRETDSLAQLFGSAAVPAHTGQGSGVIVDPDGYVLTNFHVVRNASRVWVTGASQQRLAGRVVGADALTDLALLKIEARDLTPIPWGDSDALAVGAFVWAVGSPYALERSVSFGILSAKDREGLTASPFQDFLQTDAAINPGNSGGALVDRHGHLVGINTAVIGPSFQGIGFAIPANTARQVYERLRASGRVPRGWLGVSLDAVTPERAIQLGLPGVGGAYVAAVVRDARIPSPAEQAGIRPGDVIVRWNGQPIEDPVKLSRLVARTPIGEAAVAVVQRDGAPREIKVTVGEQPDR